jgi:hypothetical protein
MNFDELQQQWKDENTDNVQIIKESTILKQAHTLIEEVRVTMKKDFFMQIKGLVMIGIYPLFIKLGDLIGQYFIIKSINNASLPINSFQFSPLLNYIFILFYAIAIAFSGYYYYLFWIFYKQSYNLSFDSRKNLMWFYYELKVNIVLYKALSYITFFLFFAFIMLAFIIPVNQSGIVTFLKKIENWDTQFVGFFLIIISFFISVKITEYWTNKMYGEHLYKIKKVLDELDEE